MLSKLLGKKTIARGALIVMLSSVITGVISFVLVPVYSNYLTPEQYGLYGVILAAMAFVQSVAGLGLGAALGRFIHDDLDNKDHVGTLVASSFRFNVVASGVICLISTVVIGLYLEDTNPSGYIWFCVIIGMICSWVRVACGLPRGLFTAHEKHHLNAYANISTVVISSLVSIVLVIWWDLGVLGCLIGLLSGATVVGGVLLVWLLKNYASYKINWSLTKSMLLYGAPLIVHLLAGGLLAMGDRFMLEFMVGLKAVGLYTVAYQFSKPIEFVIGAISQAWSPRYFKEMKNGALGDLRIRKFNSIWTLSMTAVLFGLTIIAPFGFELLISERYHSSIGVLAPVFAGVFLMGTYHLSVGPIYVAKKPKLVALVTITSAIVNIVANFLLIPHYGIMGAAYGTMISYAVMAVLVTYLSRNFHPQLDQMMKLWPCFVAIVLFCVAPWSDWGIYTSIIIALAVFTVFVFYLKKDILRKLD